MDTKALFEDALKIKMKFMNISDKDLLLILRLKLLKEPVFLETKLTKSIFKSLILIPMLFG